MMTKEKVLALDGPSTLDAEQVELRSRFSMRSILLKEGPRWVDYGCSV